MNRDKRRYLRAALMVLLLLLTAGSLAVAISRGIRDRGGQESRNETEESTPCQEETEISPEETAGTDEESSRDETKEGEDSVRETEKHPEAEEETQQEKGLNSRNQACDREEPSPQETPYQPPVLAIASDLHYQSHSITDRGKAYIDFIAGSDGKLIEYLPQLLDAFSDEIINTDVDVLILSGDITMNGEAENHQELSAKLARIQEEGIPVLVIPGNHDINNPNASYYFGDKKTQGQSVTPEEFYQYYRDLGYDQALSRDEASLSYIYELDERYWIMMLDTCQYEPVNLVGGRISEETLLWMEEWLQKAESANVTVIPVGHHNLQPQSSLYTADCALDNYQEVTELLERFRLPVYISGHLHVQRVKKHRQIPVSEERLGPGARMEAEQTYEREKEAYGIYEIVSNSLSITPCRIIRILCAKIKLHSTPVFIGSHIIFIPVSFSHRLKHISPGICALCELYQVPLIKIRAVISVLVHMRVPHALAVMQPKPRPRVLGGVITSIIGKYPFLRICPRFIEQIYVIPARL